MFKNYTGLVKGALPMLLCALGAALFFYYFYVTLTSCL